MESEMVMKNENKMISTMFLELNNHYYTTYQSLQLFRLSQEKCIITLKKIYYSGGSNSERIRYIQS